MTSSAATRRNQWERRPSLPLLLAATVQLVNFVLSAGLGIEAAFATYVDYLAWGLFAIDYGVRVWLSPGERIAFVRRHPLDLLAVLIPALRILRVVSALIRLLALSGRGLSERVIVTTVFITVALWVVAAAAVRQAEAGAADANIVMFADALWWSLVTMTTVGYGDFYPVTAEGRVIAGLLMVTGISAMGAVTGAIANKIIAGTQTDKDIEIAELRATVDELQQRSALPEEGHRA